MYNFLLFILFHEFYIFENKILSTFKLRKIETDNDITTDEYIVSLDNKNHHMILTEFESNNYETSVWVDGKQYKRIRHEKGTLMKGKFANDPNSKIFLHIKDGMNGLLVLGNNTFEIKPMKTGKILKQISKNAKSLLNNDHDHIAVLYNEKEITGFQCGNTEEQSIFSNNIKMRYYDPHFSINPNVRNVTKMLILSMAIPLEVFIDKRWGGGNASKTIDTALLHAHSMNYFYNAFNMAVLVGHIEIFTTHDFFNFLGPPLTMGDILNYGIKARKRFHDNGGLDYSTTLIFTNYTDWPAVGLAQVGVICASNNRLAAASIRITDFPTTILIMAHEIGHNFGLGHTKSPPDPNCKCAKICIMNAYTSYAKVDDFSWNTCDYKAINDRWSQFCVNFRPNFKPLDKVFCGNNVLDPDEECDCGFPSDCAAKKQDKCCDAVACKFYNSSQCVEGPCCKDCKFLSNNTACRNINNECISGVCTGVSLDCQFNKIEPNGTRCNNNKDMCYKGNCVEYGSLCADNYGDDADVGNEKCHSYFNTRTSQSGNCGYNEHLQKFEPCDKGDYLCGKIVCKTGNNSHNVGLYTVETNMDGCSVKYISKFDNDFKNILMVNDGINCGLHKFCFDNKCLSSDGIFEYKALKKCGKYASITVNDECICRSGFEKINSMCFLRVPSLGSVYAIIILLALIQIFLVSICAAFIVILFRSNRLKITGTQAWHI